VPPESSRMYHNFCRLAFGERKHNLISMTDGAECYKCRCEDCKLLLEQHHSVNHSRKPVPELSRSTEVLSDVASQTMRSGMAGTMTVDAEWGFLKNLLPQNRSAKTEAARRHLYLRIRGAQWLRMCSTHDRWPRFCEAAQRWMKAKAEGRVDGQQAALDKKENEASEKDASPSAAAVSDEDCQVVADECPLCTPNWTCGLHSRGRPAVGPASPLGDRAPGVTAEEHARMEALLARNAIPRSTLKMRLRSRLTSGSEYGVAAELQEALRLGYLHPDLGAPQGLFWKCRAGRWSLVPRAG
jgi:hypothetical protein